MIIRTGQIQALEAAAVRRFEYEMSRHLGEFSPRHCQVLGDDGVSTVIRRSMDKATSYGFTHRGPVRLYIDLVFMFGSDFDTDPLFPWASAILNDEKTPDQMERAERLHGKALEFSEATAGPDFQYAKAAFRQARSVRYEDLSVPSGDFEAACLARLHAAYPRKYVFVGDPAIRSLLREAVDQAAAHNVSTQQGVLVFIALMFALGHGFATDPLYPWVQGTLENQAISDPNKRVERLYSKTMTYLDQVIANLT